MRGMLRALFKLQNAILLSTFVLVAIPLISFASLQVTVAAKFRSFLTPSSGSSETPQITHLDSTIATIMPGIGRPAPVHKLTQTTPVSLFTPSIDCASRACIALSFDDGPNPITTPQLLTILEQRHVPSTFFVVGKNIGGHEDIIRRIAGDGYEIGNHSWSHTDLTKLPPGQIQDELVRTQTAIAAAGAPVPTLVRPPYGAIDPGVLANVGLQTALWNEDPRDWQATDPAALQQVILDSARPGGIIDLHDIHQVTVDALPGVLDQLMQRGYTFVTVSQLLHSRDRPGNAPFYGYAAEVPLSH